VSKVVTVRLSEETAARLKAAARRTGRSVSELGARAIEESLRQREFADIEFRSFGDERHVCLQGSLPIWRVIMVARGYGLDAARTAAHFGWPTHRARAAITYYEAYASEIDPIIDEQTAETFETVKRLLPRAERLTFPDVPGDDLSPT
jgi:hypothetical protein